MSYLNDLRKYIKDCEEIEKTLYNLPDLEYDEVMEKFWDKTFELVHNHIIIMKARLKQKEKEINGNSSNK